jgi:outer membrane immunogenic protein
MSRILLGGVALIALMGAAYAADLPAKAPAPMPAPVPNWDWNGFYLGVYYGNGLSQSHASTPGTPSAPGAGGTEEGGVDINNGSWLGGGTIGYNWQFAPAWLVGLEGDVGYFGGKRLSAEWDDDPLNDGEKNSWFATVRGRVGYVTGPALLYVTGGAGWVHVTDTFGGGGAGTLAPFASSATVSGGVVGAGIEVKLSRNWTTKTEYLYMDGRNHSFGSTSESFAGTPTTFSHDFQVIKTGLNYRFDGAWDPLPFFNGTMQPTTHNWNGFYAGGNLGIGSSAVQVSGLPNSVTGNADINGLGFAGGGQVGYNYMLYNKYLIGVEGDFGALLMRHTVSDWFDTFDVFTEDTSWYSTLRARVGTTTGPALLYVTGGAAWVHLRDGIAAGPGNTGPGDVTSATQAGWSFGGGTEIALDAHWSARIENIYMNVGNRTHNDTFNPGAFFGKFQERFNVVRAGLSYQFN